MLKFMHRSAAAGVLALVASAASAQWTQLPPNTNFEYSGSVGIGAAGPTMFGKLTVIRPTGDSATVWARRGDVTQPPPVDPIGSAFYGESKVPGGAAIVGHNNSSVGGRAIGVWGISDAPNGMAVAAWARTDIGANIAFYGATSSPDGYSAYLEGRVKVLGNLNVQGNTTASGTKAFRIDHPLDPQRKDLLHYSAESPEVINFYRGTVTLDQTGWARVYLPDYFHAINRDPSYTLTAVGAPMPLLHVSREIEDNSFDIAGGVPGMKVSWRIDAVRSDPAVLASGAPVEVDKAPARATPAASPVKPAPLPTPGPASGR